MNFQTELDLNIDRKSMQKENISQGIEIIEHMQSLQEQWHAFWEELRVYLIGRINKVKSAIASLNLQLLLQGAWACVDPIIALYAI